MGVRRLWDQLRRRRRDAPGLGPYAKAARACYAALRGEHARAIRLFTRVLPSIPVRERVAWHTLRAIFAGILNDVGQHARAKEVLLEALGHVRDGEDVVVGRHLELVRQLALAEAGLGRVDRGAEMLDELLTRFEGHDQPLLLGLLHKARAEIAVLARDSVAFEGHLARVEQHFMATRNPALVAQCEQLADLGRRKNLQTRGGGRGMAANLTAEIVGDSASDEQAYAAIVEKLAAWADAEEAHLFSWDDAVLHRVSSTCANIPPATVAELITRAVAQAVREEEVARTTHVDGHRSESICSTHALLRLEPSLVADQEMCSVALPLGSSYQAFVLSHWDGARFIVVGGLLVRVKTGGLCRLDVRKLAAAGAAMYERADDSATVIERSPLE